MAEPMKIIDQQCQEIEALFDQLVAPDTDHRTVMSDLTSRLAAHISVEHSVVLPVVRQTGAGGGRTARELKRDYRRMGHLLTLIERRKINSPDLPELTTRLRSEWRRHRDRHLLLQGVEERVSDAERAALSQKVERAENVILSHPHPHLLALGPISRFTTRLAARFDRARDRTVPNLP